MEEQENQSCECNDKLTEANVTHLFLYFNRCQVNHHVNFSLQLILSLWNGPCIRESKPNRKHKLDRIVKQQSTSNAHLHLTKILKSPLPRICHMSFSISLITILLTAQARSLKKLHIALWILLQRLMHATAFYFLLAITIMMQPNSIVSCWIHQC